MLILTIRTDKPEAEIEGLNADGVMRRILGKVEVPR